MAEKQLDLKNKIQHVFVLMMENRSFDHMLGFESMQGQGLDGKPTRMLGLNGNEANPDKQNQPVRVSADAPDSLSFDPKHEFADIQEQLCGPGGKYPNLSLTGFVQNNGPDVMRCFAPGRLKILPSLARQFALCDQWFSSLPGPTWPNRLFAHAATSGGLFCSPDLDDTLNQTLFGKYAFENGTIYDALDKLGLPWRIYHDGIPQAITLAGMKTKFLFGDSFEEFENFAKDLQGPYPYRFTFIEPHYGGLVATSYTEGNSQHPNGNIQAGEKLIREVYLALRNSPLWGSSALLITYDEHGGFFDHVPPTRATPPKDAARYAGENSPGLNFDFSLTGVRVLAVVISPWVPKGLIDHSVYDHASLAKTLGHLFGFKPLTWRDNDAESLEKLFALPSPRGDAPADLPEVALGVADEAPSMHAAQEPEGLTKQLLYLGGGVEAHLDPHKKPQIAAKLKGIQTRAQASQYLHGIHQRVLSVRNASPLGKAKHWLAILLKDVWATFKGI